MGRKPTLNFLYFSCVWSTGLGSSEANASIATCCILTLYQDLYVHSFQPSQWSFSQTWSPLNRWQNWSDWCFSELKFTPRHIRLRIPCSLFMTPEWHLYTLDPWEATHGHSNLFDPISETFSCFEWENWGLRRTKPLLAPLTPLCWWSVILSK